MKIKGKCDYIFNMESVAMTDIVMNLFLFFFISFSLLYTFDAQRTKSINVNLPKSSSSQASSEPAVVITVSSEDIFYLKNKPAGIKDIGNFLKTSAVSSVLIKSDKDASLGAVVRIWDICKKYGVAKIGIAAVYDKKT